MQNYQKRNYYRISKPMVLHKTVVHSLLSHDSVARLHFSNWYHLSMGHLETENCWEIIHTGPVYPQDNYSMWARNSFNSVNKYLSQWERSSILPVMQISKCHYDTAAISLSLQLTNYKTWQLIKCLSRLERLCPRAASKYPLYILKLPFNVCLGNKHFVA